MKGFIDLVFEYEGCFYIVDYKSNWLGDTQQQYQSQALNEAMIMHEQGSALQRAIEVFIDGQEVRVSKQLEFSNNEAIKRAVAEGDGVALISEKAAEEEIRAGKLIAVPLSGPPVTRFFYRIQRKDKFISRPLASLLEMLFFNSGSRNLRLK